MSSENPDNLAKVPMSPVFSRIILMSFPIMVGDIGAQGREKSKS